MTPNEPTNREAVDWEKQFDDKYPVALWLRETMLDPESWLKDIKQFIHQTHLDLLREVAGLLEHDTLVGDKAIINVFDDKTVIEIYELHRIVANRLRAELLTKLHHIITRVEEGQDE